MSERPTPAVASYGRRRGASTLRSAHFTLSTQRPKAAVARVHDAISAGPLLFAVPKRLLKHAVDRNAVRRVAREAWRVQMRNWAGHGDSVSVLLRMTSKPAGLREMSRPQRKRVWRVELDSLMARLAGD